MPTEIKSNLFEIAVQAAPFGVLVICKDGIIEFANEQARLLLGDKPGKDSAFHAVAGLAIADFVSHEELQSLSEAPKLISMISAGQRRSFEASIFASTESAAKIVYFRDVETQQNRERMLEREASTDELSGLANRRGFQRTIEANLSRSLSLAIIDIDNFKQINDLHGHIAGDDTVRHVGRMLSRHFKDTAIVVSRMGGDEFSVLYATELNNKFVELLENFREQLSECSFELYPNLRVTVSIGTAISEKPAVSSRKLLTIADRQLYLAKENGRNQQRRVSID